MSLHDRRWIDRFAYAWRNTDTYDSLSDHYEIDTNDLLGFLSEAERRLFVREGIWLGVAGKQEVPPQGWKIHLSASLGSITKMAEVAVRYLIDEGITFKIVGDTNLFEALNSKRASRSASGKFITVYPADSAAAMKIAEYFREVFSGLEGPRILSDFPYGDSRVVHVRYGQFRSQFQVDFMGMRHPIYFSPAGEIVTDQRALLPQMPEGQLQAWPFSKPPPPQIQDPGLPVLANKYQIRAVIGFSNGGGVYRAADLRTGQEIILKEARPGACPDLQNNIDASGYLHREYLILRRLQDSRVTPNALDYFTDTESGHSFLAQEALPGWDPRQIIFAYNPLMRLKRGSLDAVEYLKTCLNILASCLEAIQVIASFGIDLGDLSANNILIDPETFKVSFIDLEASTWRDNTSPDADSVRPLLQTAGFTTRDASAYKDPELFSTQIAGRIFLYLVFPVAVLSELRSDLTETYRRYFESLGWPTSVFDLIARIANGELSLDAAREKISLLRSELFKDDHLTTHTRTPPSNVEDGEQIEIDRTIQGIQESIANRYNEFSLDPFADVTNRDSFGFGRSGVLWALKQSGHTIPTDVKSDLLSIGERAITRVPNYSGGFFTGLSGIGWVCSEFGFQETASALIERSTEIAQRDRIGGMMYGPAGIGTACILHAETSGWSPRLERGTIAMVRTVKEAFESAIYEHASEPDMLVNSLGGVGLGYGLAGDAMFLTRAAKCFNEPGLRRVAEDVLEIARSAGFIQEGVRVFSENGTVSPYLENGSAGLSIALLEFGMDDYALEVLQGARLLHAVLPGYMFGIAGLVDTLDLAAGRFPDKGFEEDRDRLIGDMIQTFVIPQRDPEGNSIKGTYFGVAGEGLLRCADDFTTGAAGVLYALDAVKSRAGNKVLVS